LKLKKNLTIIVLLSFVIIVSANIFFNSDVTQQRLNHSEYTPPVNHDTAPEITNNGKWINTVKDITPENLKGKVVLLEFWTFGCYNCVNTLPYMKDWYSKYKSDNFEMIGIHCPEFDNEKNFENVRSSVEELGITYPVLTDNEFSIWKKFDVHAWPTIFLLDKSGVIRYKKVGEGKYDRTEQMIQQLLEEPYTGKK